MIEPSPEPMRESDADSADEIARAKARFREAADAFTGRDDGSASGPPFHERHPYLAALGALILGIIIARVPGLRKLATMLLLWAAKRALAQHFTRKR